MANNYVFILHIKRFLVKNNNSLSFVFYLLKALYTHEIYMTKGRKSKLLVVNDIFVRIVILILLIMPILVRMFSKKM